MRRAVHAANTLIASEIDISPGPQTCIEGVVACLKILLTRFTDCGGDVAANIRVKAMHFVMVHRKCFVWLSENTDHNADNQMPLEPIE